MNEYGSAITSAANKKRIVKHQYIEFCREAGVEIDRKIPSGIEFYFMFLFQPFKLYSLIILSDGMFPHAPLRYHLGSAVSGWANYWASMVGFNMDESRRYVGRVLAASIITLIIPLLAVLKWGEPKAVFWIFMGIILVAFLLEVILGTIRGALNFMAFAIFTGIVIGAYSFAIDRQYLSGPSPRFLATSIILVAVATHFVTPQRIIPLFTIAAVVLVSLLLLLNKVIIFEVFAALGVLAGITWNSADILTRDREPSGWRFIFAMILFPFLLPMFAGTVLRFQFVDASQARTFFDDFQSLAILLSVGFLLGYSRLVESVAINVYQCLLYLIEKLLGITTIQLSPVKYHDAHFSNLFLIPHLLSAYKRVPELSRQILNACIMAPGLLGVRTRVLEKLRPDAFLSFNSKNKVEARQLAELLKQEGLNVWYDELELMLGRRDWWKEIETAIKYSRVALILVGKEGYGPVQQVEVEACLNENKERQIPLIPLILPGAEIQDDRLTQFTFADLRKHSPSSPFENYIVQRLKFAITGRRSFT